MLTLLTVLLCTSWSYAQRTVKGTVTDGLSKQAMPGVNVVIKGTTTGTVTNLDGQYTIKVNSDKDVLVFTFIGYDQNEIEVGANSTLDVSMLETTTDLNEVVVVGYGTQKKGDLTGAVSVVNTDNLDKIKTGDISKALQGQTAGVVVRGSGDPGSTPQVRIRGVGSFNNSSPLYVIDGVPVEGMGDFAPGEIETMQVLKDASSAAIYGARGANGVIIITTKKGKKGKMRITYDGSYGVQEITKRMDVTNRVQFQEMNNLARTNDDAFLAPGNDPTNPLFISNVDTDWQDVCFKKGSVSDHSLGFSGGSDNSTYSFLANYFDQEGTLTGPGPRYERYSFKANNENKVGKLKLGSSLYYSKSHQVRLTNSQWGNPVNDIIGGLPTVSVYDKNNVGGFGGGIDSIHDMIAGNELAFNSIKHSWGDRNRFLGILYGEYEFIEGLTYKINLSYDRTDWLDHEFVPKFNVGTRHLNAIAYLNEWRGENPYMLMEHTLNFNRTFGKHKINVLAGYTAQKDYWMQTKAHAEGYEEPYFEVIDAGTKNLAAAGSKAEHSMISYLGRVNYDYDDRYLLTANFRRDASSRFGQENKWGNFPSVSVGWKLHNEEFMKQFDFISQLKLRVGYGVIGNDKIGDYLYETYINKNAGYVFNNKLSSSGIQINIVDPSIGWEEKTTKNIGVDAALFNNQLEFSAEYYEDDAHDLLIAYPVPATTGTVDNPVLNGASMTNKGMEFTVTYRKKEGEFHYEISANLSKVVNEVTSTGKTNDPVYTGISKTEVGHSMGELYGYVFEGIFQNTQEITDHAFQTAYTKPGDCKFKDIDGDGSITEKDRTYLGSALPKFTGGLNLSADYKGFDLSIFLHGSYGNHVFNTVYSILNSYKEGNYSIESYENYWRGEGTTNKYPRLTKLDANNNNRVSDRFIQDASYLRIQNIQLGYTFPKKLISFIPTLEQFRIYASVQNLYTFTKYTGFDPDFANDGLLYSGSDNGSYPSPRTILFGVKLGF
jgi:TonB-linked SusC/RagA family outer membrane protein